MPRKFKTAILPPVVLLEMVIVMSVGVTMALVLFNTMSVPLPECVSATVTAAALLKTKPAGAVKISVPVPMPPGLFSVRVGPDKAE